MRSNSAACSNTSAMCRYSATFGSMEESSSYPRSTTACNRAAVTESPVAKSVTSHPRATSPSAMLPATVSQAPYRRGGVRQATGERMAILLGSTIDLQVQRSLHARLSSTGIPARHRRRQIGIEPCGNCDVSVGHRETARRIVPSPTDPRQIHFGPRVHVGNFCTRRSAFITTHEPGGDSHNAANIAEQYGQIAAGSLHGAQRLFR